MSNRSTPALQAWAQARQNKVKRWPHPDRDSERLVPLPTPRVSPSFQLEKGSSIYTVGSCFARNIEEELSTHGFELPTLKIKAVEEDRATGRANGMLNKFVTGSMLLELEWALGGKPFNEEFFHEIAPGEYVDLSLKPGMKPVSLERVRTRRREVTENTREVARCRCVTITLGLVESWYDRELDAYLNCTPPLSVVKAKPSRFEFRVSTFDEVYRDVTQMIGLINGCGEEDKYIILTVSPVPLDTTFSGQDVLLANSYSKSVLRAVAETVSQEVDRVDYFPAYEVVTMADAQFAWGGDYRHVNSRIVRHIVQLLVENYMQRPI